MIKLKTVTMRNFLSVGAIVQAIDLDTSDITLVLGENLDLGGNDNRNGCGKTTILNAICYCLFGEPLTKIKVNNLINKINGKHMMVTLTFEKDGVVHHIERGRKPDVFSYTINNNATTEDGTQGENRITQQEINAALGFNSVIFRQLIALNTYTTPFLSCSAPDQREIVEYLLGVSTLSDKAESLKEKIKTTKTLIKDEENNINTLINYNRLIQTNLEKLQTQSTRWEEQKQASIDTILNNILILNDVDIQVEIAAHEHNAVIDKNNQMRSVLSKEIQTKTRLLSSKQSALDSNIKNCTTIMSESTCPECNQSVTNCTDDLLSKYESMIYTLSEEVNTLSQEISEINKQLSELDTNEKLPTVYKDHKEALVHEVNLNSLVEKHDALLESINPYVEQINNTRSEVKVIDYDMVNGLNEVLSHQEFLLKLLTNKDSFIRKKIITQNIKFLNDRLSHYLVKLNLPHVVQFLPDLEVEITYNGKDLDFDNLSRGERTRVILSLSWAFRDIYEAIHDHINILIVDELIDTGLDPQGVESSLYVLKDMVRKNKKSVFLISHRDELLGRVDCVLKVIKENGFTSFET